MTSVKVPVSHRHCSNCIGAVAKGVRVCSRGGSGGR